MALDLAECLIETGRVDPDELAPRFAAGFRKSRGYGPGAAKVLARIREGEDWRRANRAVFPEGSFGNGGAMRAPVVGLFYADRPERIANAARRAAWVTHAHPLGVEGAVMVAVATAAAVDTGLGPAVLALARIGREEEELVARTETAAEWVEAGAEPAPREVARRLGNGIAAAESCVTAVYLAARFLASPYEELIRFVLRVGGDTDTIGAMAGAIWGAARGPAELPTEPLGKLEQRERIERDADLLRVRSGAKVP